MTARQSNLLSTRYGYENYVELAESLPPGAEVIDIGAGASTLGEFVSRWRSDIRWLNTDLRYTPQLIHSLSKGTPSNLEFEQANALTLAEQYGKGSFDRGFSYWMLSHIRLAGVVPATVAATNMLQVIKPDNRLQIGPYYRREGLRRRMRTDSLSYIVPQSSDDLSVMAREIAKISRLRIRHGLIYKAGAMVAVYDEADYYAKMAGKNKG